LLLGPQPSRITRAKRAKRAAQPSGTIDAGATLGRNEDPDPMLGLSP
jgi:hypothetical protein